MPARKKPLFIPRTSLIDVIDALALVGASVDVAVTALDRDDSGVGPSAALMLEHCVRKQIDSQRERIGTVIRYLTVQKPRKKRRRLRR